MASAALQTAPASAEIRALMTTAENRTGRIARLQREARALALDDVEALVRQMAEVVRAADDIAQGGDAYPVGVRDAAQRLAVDLHARADTLKAIAGRVLI